MRIAKVLAGLLLSTTALAESVLQHNHMCIHDQLEYNPHRVDLHGKHGEIEDLELAVTNRPAPNMRFHLNTGTLKTGMPEHEEYVKTKLLPPVLDYYSKALKVKKRFPGNIKLPNQPALKKGCGLDTPAIYFSTGVDADTSVMVVGLDDQEGTYLATALPCFVDTTTNRPFITKVTFNFKYIKPATDFWSHEKHLYTTTHELMHALGFSHSQFAVYIDQAGKPRKGHVINQKINGKEYMVVNVEPLTSKLRAHFGCKTISGGVLENEGSAGNKNSHWERKLFGTEFMTASGVHDTRLSELTLSMLEGSGWYTVDYSMAEPFFTGKDQGCDYWYNDCNKPDGMAAFPEFCSKGQKYKIAETGNTRAYCSDDKFADGCSVPFPSESFDCRMPETVNKVKVIPELQHFGLDAVNKVFLATLNTGSEPASKSFYCFTQRCEGSGSSTKVIVTVGKQEVTCTKKEGLKVPGLAGELDCPDPVQYCETKGKLYCPRGCQGRGTCENGKCVCYKGFKGRDCTETA